MSDAARVEQMIDRLVQRRLTTDRAYRHAENAEAQAQREQEITDQETARTWAAIRGEPEPPDPEHWKE